MISYLARGIKKTAGVGLLGLVAATSASAMEAPVQQNLNPTYEASLASTTEDSLESRLSADLEMAKLRPLEFIRSIEDRYSPSQIRELKKSDVFDDEVDYATRLVSSISDPGVRFLSLYALDDAVGHSHVLRETMELARDESATFLERNGAIEHLGYLFDRKSTSKKELEQISETLYDILATDLERVQSPDVTSEDLPNFYALEALNSAHRFLQVHQKGETNAQLIAKIYESSVDPSSHHLVSQLGSWVLDSVYQPSKQDRLEASLKKTGKTLPRSERKEFSELLKNDAASDLVWSYITQPTRGSTRAPRFVYESDDYLENLWDRFEDRFKGSRGPEVKLTGLTDEQEEAVEEGLEWFRQNHPDQFFTYQLATDEVRFNASTGGFGATANTSQNAINISPIETGWYVNDIRWRTTGFRNTLRHEDSHLLSKSHLGLKISPGQISEVVVSKWGNSQDLAEYNDRGTLDLNESHSKTIAGLDKAKHWEKGKK